MSKKRGPKPFRPWESTHENWSYFRIADDMVNSEAMKDLSDSAFRLYCGMKMEYRPDRPRKGILVPTNEKNILYPVSKWQEQFTCHRDFNKRIKELVDHGFITIEERGKSTRTPNVYAFSDGWKTWTKPKGK